MFYKEYEDKIVLHYIAKTGLLDLDRCMRETY